MNKSFINYLKLKIKKKLFLKNEIKIKILKSIIQNQKNKPLKIQYAYYSLINMSTIFNKMKNTCLLTGRNASVSNNFYLSRHSLKKLLNQNKLQNIKINS